jgi:hypothetical protein
MIVRRVICLFVVVIVLNPSSFLWALELDREELEGASDADIEFENYEGPVDTVDSRDAIREIGRVMGREIGDGDAADYDQRYLLRRIIGDVEDERLAADIIELTDDARVDHIENLRRIISGYLETAWEYDRGDADLLARFITIYNAVHRGAVGLFSERYREAVFDALVPDRVGLATSYRLWAGQTQLVVPIRDDRAPGALSAVDPLQLVDSRVIDELRTRRNLGIEDRKAIIDFIERVIEEQTQAIQEERTALAEEQRTIEERRTEITAEEETAEVGQEPAVEEEAARPPDEPDAEEAPDDSGAAPDTDEEPQQSAPQDDEVVSAPDGESAAEDDGADAAQDSTEEELRQLDEREAEIEERQQELDEDEEELQVLTERVEELYEETAEDQATLSDRPAPADLVAFVLGDGSGRFELALVEFGAASVAGEQTIPVANRELTDFQGEIVVAHQSTERLIMLDPSSLSIIAESDVTVVPGSRIRAVGGHLLTVIPQDDLFVVGEFDAQLVLQRRSARPVLEYTDIVVREDELLVQGEDGELRVLQLDEVSP